MSESFTAQEGVLRELRLQIASGKLKPGQQVIQDSLAARPQDPRGLVATPEGPTETAVAEGQFGHR
jgi:DNA-binding GntR family transcriptional regulator